MDRSGSAMNGTGLRSADRDRLPSGITDRLQWNPHSKTTRMKNGTRTRGITMNPTERIDQLIAGITDWRGKTPCPALVASELPKRQDRRASEAGSGTPPHLSASSKHTVERAAVYNVILNSTPGPRTKELPEFPAYVRLSRWRPLL